MELQGSPILVVEDDRDLREAIARCLNRNGFEALEAPEGDTASSLLRERQVALVLSDLRMPGKDGLHLLEEAAEAEEPTPFVIMTGHSDLSVLRAYALGARAMLNKPFRPPELFRAIETAIAPPAEKWRAPPVFRQPVKRMLFRWSTLTSALNTGLFNIGSGGFFVALDHEPPAAGTIIEFEFDFYDAPSSNFRGVGVIRWARRFREMAGPRGCGVELIHLNAESRAKIVRMNRIVRSRAYIPVR
ncbi:MAG TPA: response regulator [Bdellovibrionales bacterium]|nr:response regulator [Bdellovibrionales bacterium]